MTPWIAILWLGLAGAIGGLINAFLASEGFVLWRLESLSDGRRIWRPGFIGNVLVGVVTAVVLAGLYSPLGSIALGGAQQVGGVTLTIRELAGAIISGIGGARLLTNEVDKRYEESARRNLSATVQNMVRGTTPSTGGEQGGTGGRTQ